MVPLARLHSSLVAYLQSSMRIFPSDVTGQNEAASAYCGSPIVAHNIRVAKIFVTRIVFSKISSKTKINQNLGKRDQKEAAHIESSEGSWVQELVELHRFRKCYSTRQFGKHDTDVSRVALLYMCKENPLKIFGCMLVFIAALFASSAEAQQTVNGCQIKRKTSCPNVNLSGADLTKSNLSGADLSGANLSGANLSADRITEANLVKANLYNANLSEANLSETYMTGANLSRANLAKANLSQSSLPDANLREANLSGADLSLANLKGADLTGANAKGAVFLMTLLTNANLTRVDLTEATLTGTNLRNTILEGAKFCKTTMPDKSINNSGCPK